VKDYLSMLRAYRMTVLRKLLGRYENGMLNFRTKAANTELLIHIAGLSYRISEVPCRQRYDIRDRQTRMKTLELIANHIRLVSKHWSNREIR